MKPTGRLKFIILFALTICFTCLPIWFFEYYVNQDGSPHLYNSYLILEILSGSSNVDQFISINPYPIPNLSGHWIMAFLLLVFTPMIVTKVMVTFTFAGFASACAWLRFQTVGSDGLNAGFLFGTALAFNWLWFLGFYNFILGLIGFTFALGLYWRWREDLNLFRSVVLSVLIVFVYFSHLISFGMLLGSISLIAIISTTKKRKRNFLLTALSFIPVAPLIFGYRMSAEAGGSISPEWNYLRSPFSFSDWIMQIQAGDPLQLISRKAFPFASFDSAAFAPFSSLLLIFLLILLLSVGALIYRNSASLDLRKKLPWMILTGGAIVFWMFAPDHFGKSHGSLLRERVLLCGLVCFIPIFEFGKSRLLKILFYACISVIIAFQTLVLWEYSVNTDKIARNYLTAKPFIANEDKLASVVFIENSCRYKASSLSNLNPLLGIGKETIVWDNYELGYYLFPVIAKDTNDQRFIFDLREANAIDTCNPNENVEEKLSKLELIFLSGHEKISVLLVWDEDARLKPIISKWFEVEPYFQNGKVKLYRHK